MLSEVSREVDHTHQSARIAVMHKHKMDSLRNLCISVASLPDDDAIQAIGRQFPAYSDEFFVFHLKAARKALAEEAREKRNRRIAILARKGKTNSEIARMTGVSYSTAAKVAATALRGEMP